MIRWWGGVVWALVAAIAAAVALETLLVGDAAGGAGAVSPGLRLNEILAGPARDWDGDGVYDSKGDEWLEVQNVGSVTLAIEDYRLTDADRTVRMALGGTLMPGEVKLITGSAAVAWQRSQGLTTAGLSLNNSGDTVYLLHVAGTDTAIVDSHVYGSIEGASDRSVGHVSSQSEDWILFDSLNRYTGSGTPPGSGCGPTPGSVNGCATDVSTTTWGAIKLLYR
jgi:lamin tail-like protein